MRWKLLGSMRIVGRGRGAHGIQIIRFDELFVFGEQMID
jgi:hypothetical protein